MGRRGRFMRPNNIIGGLRNMKKKLIFWVIAIVFFIIYFQIFNFFMRGILPINPVSNVLVILILIVVNIPLSVFSTEKIFSIIRK